MKRTDLIAGTPQRDPDPGPGPGSGGASAVNGPQHYAEAQRDLAESVLSARERKPKSAALALASAQVHATLALAAATALSSPSTAARQAWAKVMEP